MHQKIPNLQGKTALITGASSGLGEQFAYILAAANANLVLVARRVERLEALQSKLEQAYNIKVTVIQCDLAEPQAPDFLFNKIKELGLKVDVLINNAGVGVGDLFYKNNPDDLKNMLLLNMVNLTLLTQLLVKDMISRRHGSILMVSSIAGDLISPRMLAYSATKSFVTSLGLGLHVELANTGVNCSVVAPGPMQTEFFTAAGIKGFSVIQRVNGIHPQKVALLGLEGLFDKQPYIVPGVMNKLSILMTKLIPRVWTIRIIKMLLALG